MRKKELLEIKKLCVTPKILQMVREDKETSKTSGFGNWKHTYSVYNTYQYYRAVVENGILKLAVFTRKRIAAGDTEPQYEIFLSKEEEKYLTHEPETGRWLTAKIDMLSYDMDNGYTYGNKPWASPETKKLVNDYLETGQQEVKEAILHFQQKIKGKKLELKRKNELEAIDAVMNAVPPLPKDFDKWVLDSAFIHERYILYKSGKKVESGYCTHCETEVPLKGRPHHNQGGICPKCKSRVLMKTWKKQKYLIDDKEVGILQKLTDGTGYILRRFHCKVRRTQEKDWKVEFAGCWEKERFRLDLDFRKQEYFEYGEYKNTGVIRWCHESNRGYSYYYERQTEQCVLYSRNLKKLLKDTAWKYIPVAELLKNCPGWYTHPTELLYYLKRHPKTEYLLKAGLYRMVWDLSEYGNDNAVDWDAKKPWDVLRVTKEQLIMCVKMNISKRELETLQKGNENGIRLNQMQVRFFTKEFGSGNAGKIFRYGHVEKLQRYLEEGIKTSLIKPGDYMDYLDDLRAIDVPITLHELLPKNFQSMHQEVSLVRQEREDKLKQADVREKNKILRKMLPELRELYKIEDETYTVILPECKADFQKEGQANHNCVGGTYFDKMLERRCVILFLRTKENPKKTFCTVEMDGSEIKQCRSDYNRDAPKEAWEFMKRLSKEVDKRLKKRAADSMKPAV